MSRSPAGLPWWTGVPSAQAAVPCGDAVHSVTWRDGVLITADHADPEGERALTALGGEPLACITLLEGWERHAHDLEVLLLGSRGASDTVTPPEVVGPRPVVPPRIAAAQRAAAWQGGRRTGSVQILGVMGSRGPSPSRGHTDEEQLIALLSVGGGLSQRLQATVAAHWRERLLDPDRDHGLGLGQEETARTRARLHAALYGRVLATLAAWLGRTDLTLQLEMVPEGTPPTLRRKEDGSYAAALPFGWLVEVWGRGLEIFWGRFCLSATTADGREWELATVGPDLGDPVALTVTLPD